MKMKNLLAAFLLFFCTSIVYAQTGEKNQSFKTITLAIDKETAFDSTIDYLRTRAFFIQSVDMQAGFIQAKVFVKHKKILSAKVGERITMNFILRPKGNETKVTLDIYKEDYSFGGSVSNRSYYYEDKGVVQDEALHQDILAGLQKATQQ